MSRKRCICSVQPDLETIRMLKGQGVKISVVKTFTKKPEAERYARKHGVKPFKSGRYWEVEIKI